MVINQNPLTSTTLATHTANLSNNNARNSLQDSGNESEINSDSSSFSDDSQLEEGVKSLPYMPHELDYPALREAYKERQAYSEDMLPLENMTPEQIRYTLYNFADEL